MSGAYDGPIIDVHLHAYPPDEQLPALPNPATGLPMPTRTGAEHREACLAELERLTIVTGIVSGGSGDRFAAAEAWHDRAPDRIVAGAGIRGSADVPLPELDTLREAFETERFRVLGELTAQYAGLTMSHPLYQPVLSLAEELDVPVAVHTGVGPPGTSYDPCCRGFRVSLGRPSHLEEALNRHPRLRVSVMHAGWPYLADIVALMAVYPQVYADLGSLNWYFPRAEFHAYLEALVRAGLGKRLMFGSDQMYWPEAIGKAVAATAAAPFLSATEKRAIFHDNAAHFFRLAPIS